MLDIGKDFGVEDVSWSTVVNFRALDNGNSYLICRAREEFPKLHVGTSCLRYAFFDNGGASD